ncbi:DUF5131 family protein [soil metagenome]
MSEQTKIQWTTASWNPWHGCRKVSDGCKFCYMYRDKSRYGQDPTKVVRSRTTFNQPLKMTEPSLIFTCSWSDWFIEEADAWRGEAWKIIKDTPHHTYQILTKRPENIVHRLPDDWGEGYENVWLGVSVEHQEAADERIESLLYVKAKTRFLSVEPLLGEVDLTRIGETQFSAGTNCLTGKKHRLYSEDKNLPKIDWVIIGGESGNHHGKFQFRPCELEWIENLVWQCNSADVPVFVKQLGTYLSDKMNLKDSHGGDISEFPEDLQIREFPNA